MLADEVARLSRPAPRPSDDDAPPPPSSASCALADRLRLGRRIDEDPLRESRGLEPHAARIRGATSRVDTAYTERDPITAARLAGREDERRRRRRFRARFVGVGLPVVALTAATYGGAARIAAPDIEAHGPEDDHIGGAAELPRLALWARANPSALDRLRWTVDGFDVTARATHAGDRVVLDARSLGDGRAHRLGGGERAVSSAGRKTTGHVTVDTQPPDVRVASTTVQKGSPLRLSGRIEADATVAVEGKPLELQDGAFTITYVSVPSRRLALVAKDAFGNGDEARTADPPATGVQRALVRGKRIITRAVPGAAVRTMALPLGVPPRPASRAVRGRWEGETYRHDGVFLVGAGPAPSPFSRAWRRTVIPRIKTGPWHGGEPDFASGFWLDVLRRHPERRYVSDGDPSHIFFPRKLAPQLAPRLRSGRTRTSGRRSLTTRLLPPWRPSGSSSAVP